MIIEKPDFENLMKLYQMLEPYQYFELYLKSHMAMLSNEPARIREMCNSPSEFVTQNCFLQTGTLGMSIPEMRIITIDEDLIPIIEDTKPDYSELRLKYPAIFVNHQIKINEDSVINGFLIVDYAQIEKEHPDIGWITDEFRNQIRILVVGVDKRYGFEFYSINPVSKEIAKEKVHIQDTKEKRAMIKLSHKAIDLGCNLINLLVNDEKDIEEVKVNVMPGQNEKRIKRGKAPMRDITYLRIGGKLKKYVTEYNQHRGKALIRYYVGGFWRHYKSERYKNMHGKKKWIFPFYKGMSNLPLSATKHIHVKKIEMR